MSAGKVLFVPSLRTDGVTRSDHRGSN